MYVEQHDSFFSPYDLELSWVDDLVLDFHPTSFHPKIYFQCVINEYFVCTFFLDFLAAASCASSKRRRRSSFFSFFPPDPMDPAPDPVEPFCFFFAPSSVEPAPDPVEPANKLQCRFLSSPNKLQCRSFLHCNAGAMHWNNHHCSCCYCRCFR